MPLRVARQLHTTRRMGLLERCSLFALTLSCAAPVPAPSPRTTEPNPPPAQGSPMSLALPPSNEAGRGAVRPLQVPGFETALLFAPIGDSPRPLVVAAHGAGGGPEWECDYWRRLTHDRVFVLCLSGTPLGGSYAGYFFRDHRALNRELAAAVRAARAAEPRILQSSGIYAGFSQGATMGTPIIAQHAEAFPYAVLIEGFMPWNVPGARQFLSAGGRRVLLACGSKECAAVGKTSLHWLQVAGAEAHLEYAPGSGHTPAGAVMAQVASALPWLLNADPNWP